MMFRRLIVAALLSCVGLTSLPVHAATQGSPSSAVGGSFRIGNDNAVCDSTTQGSLRFSSAGTFDGCDGTNWTTFSGGGSGAVTLISTQTASASATLQWTGLGSSYTYLRLLCTNLVSATSGSLVKVQLGQGGTPTWQTANYSVAMGYAGTMTGSASFTSTNYSGFPAANDPTSSTSGYMSFDMTLYNMGGSGSYKNATWNALVMGNGTTSNEASYGGGNYNGNTTAITAVRVLYSAGNITSGQCSLYGFQ